MPAPDPDDPRWSLELAGGALMDLGCYGLHAIYVMSRQTAIRPQVCAAHASQRFPGVDEWYDVGVFHRRRQCRHHPRVRAGGHPYRVFIAHDLDEDNRTLLRARKISAVLHHDLRADANLAGRLINQTYGGMRGVATAMSSIRVVTPFNML